MDQTAMKIEAARAALAEVRDGMRLGLGTGSTAAEFVRLLAASGLRDVHCTCTSAQTEQLANSLGITTFKLAELAPLDLAVDGADALDEKLRLIKGGGGALLREKIVEQAAARFIVIADETKVVTTFAGQKLPVEVTPFAKDVLEQRFAELGPVLRIRDGAPRVTDEGHLILDVRVPDDRDIADVVAWIKDNAGVVDTGFFPKEATEAIIATAQGLKRMIR
ncbi:MAG TPA: ribose-5-phosphate isomerase RpiA [Thermoanaerobaculia bacterium]|nr:ribose-5-phosphate isomerase RpiA [Thermoanaerobaculia bacterium]